MKVYKVVKWDSFKWILKTTVLTTSPIKGIPSSAKETNDSLLQFDLEMHWTKLQKFNFFNASKSITVWIMCLVGKFKLNQQCSCCLVWFAQCSQFYI